MKAYLAIKFKEDHSNKGLVDDIDSTLKRQGIETCVMARDFEKWGNASGITPELLMRETFRAIDDSRIVIIELSEKGVGIGIEAGYAYAKNKPIIVIAKKGSDISNTLKGIAKQVIFYGKTADISIETRNID